MSSVVVVYFLSSLTAYRFYYPSSSLRSEFHNGPLYSFEQVKMVWSILRMLVLAAAPLTLGLSLAASNGSGSVIRSYYIAAVEQDWDYLPSWVHLPAPMVGAY